MLVKPVADTAFVDPFLAAKTLVVVCNICDPITGEDYTRDPRNIARKAEAFLKGTGLADTPYFGPECEFFIFDDIRYDQNEHEGYYHIDSAEGRWNTGREENPNLGYKIRYKEGYFPVPPERHAAGHPQRDDAHPGVHRRPHRGAAPRGGHRRAVRDRHAVQQPASTMADNVLKYKYVVKNTAKKHDKVATFMPKPLFGDNGSGMHVHMSLWKGGKNLFAGDGYAGLSQMALHAIGGLLKHAPSILAFATPTTNSFKRLVPGLRGAGEPRLLAAEPQRRDPHPDVLSVAQGQAPRVPLPRPELQPLPHLLRHAHGGAGRHPEQDRPGQPLDKDIYDLPPEELAAVPKTPGSLREVLKALRERPRLPAEGRRVHHRT